MTRATLLSAAAVAVLSQSAAAFVPACVPALRATRSMATSGPMGLRALAGDDPLRVYLVRHGAVDLTTPGMTFPKDCFYGGHDVPLSTLGKEEAQAAADTLEGEGIEMVFCSPLQRAAFGAACVADKLGGMELLMDDRFKEINRGRWLGLTRTDINQTFPEDLKSFQQDPEWKGHGGESYSDLTARVLAGLDDAMAAARAKGAKRVALVSHMWVTKAIITTAMGILPQEQDKWIAMEIPTGSISVLDYPAKGRAAEVVQLGIKPALKGGAGAKVLWGG
mmetsp:Transcript_3117/g.7412  ORF Transcript_3117/g.7412 Transcript_3117/m.7412 type:complete len:278 (-) Transcript_3117:63-896(-)|eukprot:CAMPEP_0180124972 /NCGR_PEP_ID=MMETSP0986-20121125/4937_1 /TAXON_ID=697907 /ORGANISM="non described non described, Strain CCMP2293" /LENGTH=277 /DNA_ID=CAMNT_0022064349 /DNA_START=22 /DNA_END=855 /DNA_ORIENTATION=-